MTTGTFQPRRLGARLLVAPLAEDCLGTVYRALHENDEHRFVRLRVLQSPELSPAAIFSAVARHGKRVSRLSHKTIVQDAEFAIQDGTPFVCWYENAGWTLDVILARLRASATLLPIPFALLIAERVCAALEHAWFSPVDGEPMRHGLLWPGFVSISNDAEVRLGGFGLADGVLPALSRGRLARDIAPYVAPESRESGKIEPSSDAYSVGVLLLELLTCRRPSTGLALSAFRAEDNFPSGVQSILDKCFAPPEARPLILELHRSLQEILASGALTVSSADLAYFLYTLLNPESRSIPMTDGESTNPVAADAPQADRVGQEPFRTRRTDSLEIDGDSVRLLGAEEEAPFPAALPRVAADAPPKKSPRPASGRPSAPEPPRRIRRRLGALAYFGAAAAVILGFELFTSHRRAPAPAPEPAPAAAIAAGADLASPPAAPSAVPASPRSAPATEMSSAPRVEKAVVRTRRIPPPATSSAVTARRDRAGSEEEASERRAAEDARFRAAWSRIEAERREASELATEAFDSGRSEEAEAARRLRDGDFAGARVGFDRAAEQYRDAENASRQTRLARIRLSTPSS